MFTFLFRKSQQFPKLSSPFMRGSLYYLGFWGVIGIFIPFLNVYFRQELGFNGRQIGFLAMVPAFTTLLVAIPISSLADRRHWRIPLLKAGLIGFSLMLILAIFPHTFVFWGILRLGMAFFATPIFPLADSIIARMSIRHHLNYGSMRLWGSFSFALTAIAGGALWQQMGFEAMFVIAGIALLPALFFASSLEEGPGEVEQQVKISLWEIRNDIGLVFLVTASFLVGATIYLSLIFDGIYMNSLGGSQVFVGLMFGVTAFSELPTMHYSFTIIERLGGPKTLLLACSLLMLAFVGYTLAWQPWMLLFTAMIKGLGFGLFWITTIRLTNERAPESWASTIQSILTASSFGLAPLLVSPLSGELYDRFGPKAIFVCGSLLVGGSALIFLVAIFKRVFTDGTGLITTTP